VLFRHMNVLQAAQINIQPFRAILFSNPYLHSSRG
jgi:hypothetical protein